MVLSTVSFLFFAAFKNKFFPPTITCYSVIMAVDFHVMYFEGLLWFHQQIIVTVQICDCSRKVEM